MNEKLRLGAFQYFIYLLKVQSMIHCVLIFCSLSVEVGNMFKYFYSYLLLLTL